MDTGSDGANGTGNICELTSTSNANHTIQENKRSKVEFTNERKTGELTIVKRFATNSDHTIGGDSTRYFRYQVALSGQVLGFDVSGAKIRYKLSSASGYTDVTSSSFYVTASSTDAVTITGIPVGTTYTVTETGVCDGATVSDLNSFNSPAFSSTDTMQVPASFTMSRSRGPAARHPSRSATSPCRRPAR